MSEYLTQNRAREVAKELFEICDQVELVVGVRIGLEGGPVAHVTVLASDAFNLARINNIPSGEAVAIICGCFCEPTACVHEEALLGQRSSYPIVESCLKSARVLGVFRK